LTDRSGALNSERDRDRLRPKGVSMLSLTDRACEVIQQLVESDPKPDAAGIRIATARSDNSTPRYGLVIVTGPDPGDTVVEDRGARLYLDDAVSEALDRATLDAKVDPKTRKVEFSIS
jgi:Fe-S cluster assembly iron-binding protein IscA